MKVIGLTGGTGTGKTTALRVLEDFGGICIDADKVYHDLLSNSENMIREIEKVFPNIVFEGRVNRRKLGEIVFNDKTWLRILNGITHKYVCNEIKKIISEHPDAKFAAIDAVELIESGASELCDVVIGVIAPVKLRIERIMERERISMGYATMRIAAQKPDSYYEENCDIIIKNDFSEKGLFEKKCFEIFKNILEE